MKFFFVIVFLFLYSCSLHYLGDPLESTGNQNGKRVKISYELIGWGYEDHKIHATEILSTLHKSGEFEKIESAIHSNLENRIQIILVSRQRLKPIFGEQTEPVSRNLEKNPGKSFITILDRILFVRSFFIIPFFVMDETNVTFRHWKENQILKDYSYSLKNLISVGWIPMFFMPFDDHAEVESMYEKVTKKFINDFYGDIR